MKFLVCCGFVCIFIGLTLLISYLSMTGREEPTYVESSTCRTCHESKYEFWSATKHATLKPEASDSEGMKYRTTTGLNLTTGHFAEAGVACEDCHGPGSMHPQVSEDHRTGTIFSGAKLTPARGAMLCGRCHAAGKSTTGRDFPEGFKPGQDLNKGFTVERPPKHTDLTTYSEWVISKHAAKGVGCLTCHDPHGATGQPHQLRMPVTDLCRGCHRKVKGIKTHQPGAPASATRCSDCHMPHGVHLFSSDVAARGMEELKTRQ